MKIYKPAKYNVNLDKKETVALDDAISVLKELSEEMSSHKCLDLTYVDSNNEYHYINRNTLLGLVDELNSVKKVQCME